MAKQRPILCKVQGGIMPMEAYASLNLELSKLGYLVTHPIYPTMYTSNLVERGTKSLQDDAASVRSVITRLVEGAGQEVFVICHSYGGLVSSEAITESLTAKWRHANGLSGGVVHLYFMSAAVIGKGTAISKDAMANQLGYMEDQQVWTFKDNETMFYSDLTAEEGRSWGSMHRWMSLKPLTDPLTNEGWRHVDSTFLVTGNDRVWPSEVQKQMATNIGAEIDEIYTGHSPWLTQAEEVARRIDAVARHASPAAME